MRLRRVGEGVGYFAPPVDREVQLLEIEEIPFAVLRRIVKVRDPALGDETAGTLQLSGPDRSIGPGRVERRGVGRIKREYWPALAVAESFDSVRLSVPPWIRQLSVLSDTHLISHVPVAEHVSGVIENNVEDAVDPQLVRRVDQVAQVFARAEMRVDVEEVLNAISVIGRLERYLLEDGADPDCCHSQPA
jgi:hypothetical protein